MSSRLCDTASHGYTEMLLAHLCLLRELEADGLVDVEVLHLALQLLKLIRQLLLLWNHAHVYILLVRCRYLLLLLLQHFNLLGKSQLFHCGEGQ